MVTGRMIKLMDLVNTRTLMEPNMKATGSMISNMVKEKNIGPMAHNMRVNISTARKTDMVNSCGLIVRATAANSSTIIFTAREHTPGQMDVSTMETGSRTKCMARVCSPGPTAVNTKVNTTTTRSRDMVSSIGQTAGNTMATGCPASRKASAYTSTQRERCAMVDGRTASASNGYQKTSIIWKFNN